MSNFYHVTTVHNWKQIRKSGYLKPMIGPRSQKLKEAKSNIYGFKSIEAASDGVMQWLGDEFSDADTLVLLCITVDDSLIKTIEFEQQINQPILTNQIDKVISPF